jgi:hypothetical protein
MLRPSLFACLIGALFVLPALGRDLRVPDPFPTLQEAFGALEDGDRIVIAPGSYSTAPLVSSGVSFSLVGAEGRDSTTLVPADPGQEKIVFCDAGGGSFSVRGITFDSREGYNNLFALVVRLADVAVEECRFVGGSGADIDSCTGFVRSNEFIRTFDGLKIAGSPLRIEENLFAENETAALSCRGSQAEIFRNRFYDNKLACISVVGKKNTPRIGGSPGKGNAFLKPGSSFIANHSKNDVNAQYNYWGVAVTSAMEKMGYPANLQEIQDQWDPSPRPLGMVDYRNWLRSEEEIYATPAGRSLFMAVAVVIGVAVVLLILLARRRRAN